MALPYPSLTFTPFDSLPASSLNEMRANEDALQDWSAYTAGTFPGALLQAGAITPEKLALGGTTSTITTSRTRTGSSAYGDPTSATDPGPSVTVTVPSSGVVLVTIGCNLKQSTTAGGERANAAVDISGANTIAAGSDGFYIRVASTLDFRNGISRLFTGLTPGSTTFKMVYQTNNPGTTVTMADRSISVIPLG